MERDENARCWDGNADAWTKLSRAGYDVYRDFLNTPAFLAMLPDVSGRRGIDIGCGEGSNTRLVAGRGARVIGIDVSPRFVEHALEAERREPIGIEYRVGDAIALPFRDAAFEFAVAFMSLMDVPDHARAIAEAFRVLEPGGFLQFSILHPCTNTRHRRNLRDATGKTFALEVGRYFERTDGHVDEWLFSAAPAEAKQGLPLFRVPTFHRTVAEWMNAIVAAGFAIERVEEPFASDDVVRRCPSLQDTQQAPYFLHVRCRKPR
ncbi:MAG: class I SAM-dependent methyltransferase [Planctomycetes bacterium]|nr:class I SAM-dependent methyltransferase [Planctomycetota bacterium]MBI3848138.1 class I SAM-dependent methyltransferase [Planctomycetota bacterium]